MNTIYNNSFDSSPNSDSDDDFMVDNIIPINCNPCNSKPSNINSQGLPSWMNKNVKCNKIVNVSKRNANTISKLPLKRCMSNVHNTNTDKNQKCTKFIKLTSRNNRSLDIINSRLCNPIHIRMNTSNTFDECVSNPPSPYTESDKTHSVESSPSCILLNDPIITSVVLNEKRFNSSNDSRLPSDDNFFNDIPMSFDKSYYSSSIDDNLLRPMRSNQFLGSSNQVPFGANSINRNNSFSVNTFNKIESGKRSRSMGLDLQTLTQDRRVRSSESLEISKYVVSETASDSTHSVSNDPVTTNYPKKPQTNNGHNKRKHLLQFIIDLLKEGNSCVNWSNKKDKEFCIAYPEKLALLWASYKNNNKMTFDSLARSLRLYYAPKKLERISGKKNHYRILNLSHEISFNL